ncbi:MAG: GNAT family N-acetyltransferase [Anaerolineaceae bacterium]
MDALASITTARLVLRTSDPSLAAATADFYRRNAQPHARWSPPVDASAHTVEAQAQQLALTAQAIAEGQSIAWWLFLPDDPDCAIGQMHLSQIHRRAFQSAMLGYSIDHRHEGRGLMAEALRAALADAFGPRVALHRVQANVRPENTRSLALLDRLGFVHEGLAREYLFIDGAWRDHVMTARVNPAWPRDRAPG